MASSCGPVVGVTAMMPTEPLPTCRAGLTALMPSTVPMAVAVSFRAARLLVPFGRVPTRTSGPLAPSPNPSASRS
ncbi:hypothetical protein D1871_08240 [Nakamurella silvestris]|nr:hypothetical protein D1871_08240 [Nakamurella silvestris]